MLLITGITGLTGRFLYYELQDKLPINSVKHLVRSTSDTTWMGNGCELVYGDISNVNDICSALDGVEAVIHLVNIRSSPQIIEACKKKNVGRVIFVNTTGMYSKYRAYSELYRNLEKDIENSGLDYTIIRPTMIYGNKQDKNIHKLVKLMNKLPVFPVLGSGNALMQPIYARDLAKVIVSAYLKPEVSIKKDYNVAGKEPLTYLSLLQEIAKALGKNPKFIHVPFSLALLAGRIGDFIPNGLINYEKVQRLSENKNFDYSKAAEELDFKPISFQEGIKLEIEALKADGII